VARNAKDGHVADLKTWEPMLQRCQKEVRGTRSATFGSLDVAGDFQFQQHPWQPKELLVEYQFLAARSH